MRNKISLLLFFYSFIIIGQSETITRYNDPAANGTLFLQIRNDSVKYICNTIKVENGVMIPCDNNKIIDYKYYINRNRIESNWLNEVLRLYDTWIEFPKYGTKGSWLNYEKSSSIYYKETFTSDKQKTGITYKHHETRKNLINYVLANPKGKAFEDERKNQFQYEWEEIIRGRYEVYYFTGIKKFKHSYEINRIMTLEKGIALGKKYFIDAQISGSIYEYYPSGKKKLAVTYNDRMVKDNSSSDNSEKIASSNLSGERISYNEKGRLSSKGNISSKGLNGKVEYFGPKGLTVIKIEHYKNGALNGKYFEYYMNGKVKTKAEYKNGELIGEIQEFNEEGTPKKG